MDHQKVNKKKAVNEHTNGTGHTAALGNFEIIGRERSRNDYHLKIKESPDKKNLLQTLMETNHQYHFFYFRHSWDSFVFFLNSLSIHLC